ncbi:hypothetical protein P4S72_23840 [Vibrio sp. PP-XX7]
MLNRSRLRNALYMLPALVIYSVFLLFPLLASLGVSLTQWGWEYAARLCRIA